MTPEYMKAYEKRRWKKRMERRAAGLCDARITCTGEVVGRGLCADHLAKRIAAGRKFSKKAYQQRKEAGLCVFYGCANRQQEDCLLCWEHEAWQKRYQTKNKKQRDRHRKAWRKKRIKAGLCGHCGKRPLETKRRCEECLERNRVQCRAKWLAAHPNASRTREQRALRGLDVGDFIRSGGNNLAEAQK